MKCVVRYRRIIAEKSIPSVFESEREQNNMVLFQPVGLSRHPEARHWRNNVCEVNLDMRKTRLRTGRLLVLTFRVHV